MFKEFYEQHGRNLIFEIKDVMGEESIKALPFEKNITDLLVRAFQDDSFNTFTEEECILITKEFVEPVAYKDIDIEKYDVFYSSVRVGCQMLWQKMPHRMHNIVYGNN